MPVLREVGAHVYGCTVNQRGLLYLEVTSAGSDSALSQIVQLVEGKVLIIFISPMLILNTLFSS